MQFYYLLLYFFLFLAKNNISNNFSLNENENVILKILLIELLSIYLSI